MTSEAFPPFKQTNFIKHKSDLNCQIHIGRIPYADLFRENQRLRYVGTEE